MHVLILVQYVPPSFHGATMVWVDLIDFQLGKVMVIGLVARRLLVTGAFSTRKWPVAPESDMACFTDLVTLAVSKIAAACGNSCKLFACTIV